MIVPGMAPMYVRRWPRISASSRTPPTEMRTNLRPSVRAIEWPSDVLPTPGGPTKQRIGPERSPSFSFETARYSRIRSFTLSRSKWSSSRTFRAWPEVEVVLRLLVPGQAEDPLDIGADDAVLGRCRRELLEPGQLTVDSLTGLFGELDLVRAVAELLDLGLLGIGLAELLLDRLQLLAQEVLALRGLHLGDDLVLDLRPELGDLELAVEDHEHRAESLLDVLLLEQLLLLLGLQAQRRRDEVTEGARVVDVRGGKRQLLGEVRDEPDQAGEERLDVLHQRLGLRRLLVDVGSLDEAADEVGLVLHPVEEADSGDPLHEDAQRAVGDADHLLHDRGRANLVEVVPAGLLELAGPSRLRARSGGCRRRRPRRDAPSAPGRSRAGAPSRGTRPCPSGQDRQLRRELELVDFDLLFHQLGHVPLLMRISTRSGLTGFLAKGRTIVRMPRLYVALAASTSMSAESAIWRVNRP